MKIFCIVALVILLNIHICEAKTSNSTTKVCEFIKNSFDEQNGTPWNKYQNVAIFLINNYAHDLNDNEAMKNVEKVKNQFLSLSEDEKRKDLYSFYKEIRTEFKCSKKITNKVKKEIESYYLPLEEKKYKECIGNLKISSTKLLEFVWDQYINMHKRPEKGYVYKNPSRMNINYLKVFQKLPDGVLVVGASPNGITDKVIYIKTDENYVDDDMIDPDKDGYYTYIGTKKYGTVLGASKTVHAFEKVNIDKCLKEIYFYKP